MAVDTTPTRRPRSRPAAAPPDGRADGRVDGAGRRRRPPSEPPRRLVPAGHALLVLVIALCGAALLNARGMHKTANEQPPGTGRDIAVALTGALTAITGAFQLDEPRKGVQALLGRAGDDDISSRVHYAHRKVAATRQRSAAKPVFSAAHPLRLYVTGDSLLTDPGKELLEKIQGRPAIEAVGAVDTHAATGLAQPLVFNWFDYIPQQLRSLRPNLVVLGFGGNDGQDLFGDGGGQHFGTPEWVREYSRRVGGIMDDAIAAHAKVIWVGLPIPRDPGLAQRFEVMNSIYAQQARQRAGDVVYLDMYRRFADRQGRYEDYLPDASGQLRLMRKPDGIHYELPAAQIVADEVLAALPKLVRLEE